MNPEHCVAGRRWPTAPRLALAGAAVSLLLSGCAAPQDTLPHGVAAAPAPVVGPSARLLLRGSVAAQDRYALLQLADAVHCKGPSLLIGGTPQRPPEPAQLSAGVLTTLDFVILRDGQLSCGVRWSFTPVAGRTYLMQGMALGSGCTARLLDASVPDRPVPPPDAALRSTAGQSCVPLAQARASTGANALIQGGQDRGEAVLIPHAGTRDLQGLIRP